jgi:hypothetical protein
LKLKEREDRKKIEELLNLTKPLEEEVVFNKDNKLGNLYLLIIRNDA